MWQLQYDHLLALTCTARKRIFSHLVVDGYNVHFLLDCGSTGNLLPSSVLRPIDGEGTRVRFPAAALWLRLFNNTTQLKTSGMITFVVQHSRTLRKAELYFTQRRTTNSRSLVSRLACSSIYFRLGTKHLYNPVETVTAHS